MDYTFSWFTAWMPEPATYMHQIFDYIPQTLNWLVRWLNEPIVIVMVILTIVLWFIFALLGNNE